MAPPKPNDAKTPGQTTPTRPTGMRPSPSKAPSVNGVGRSPSARGGLQRPVRGGLNRTSPQTSFLSTNSGDDQGEEEARAEHISLLDELRSRVQKAETASEEYQRQLNLLQARLDESQQSHGRLEDQLHEKREQLEELETEKVQAARQKRDLEKLFEEERAAMLKDRDEQNARNDGLQTTLQRLRENLVQKEQELAEERESASSRAVPEANVEGGQFAPPLSVPRSDENAKLVEQKDRVIKSLRLELADAQIKIMEIDSVGDGKYHDLEKKLLETQIANARLMEDNDSFQLLLQEKTLNGDFSKTDAMQTSTGLGSLAEELGTEDIESAEDNEGKNEDTRKLEVENKSLKDQNKALALYIENIIGRLLSHSEFENILDKNPDLMSGAPAAKLAKVNTDKDLPPPPPEKDQPHEGGSFLQRAKSVIAGPTKPRPRPMSQMPPPSNLPAPIPSPLPNEDPATAPSIPLGRSQSVSARGGGHGHKRSQSEMPGAAPIVNQMYRGPPSMGSTNVGGPLMSPGLSPSAAPRPAFFSPSGTTAANSNLSSPSATPRPASGPRGSISHDRNPESDTGSVMSDQSGGGVEAGSPPRNSGAQNNYPGAIMTQNRLRPLRLVQNNPETAKKEDEAAAARKKANRGSWMPTWMAQRAPSGGESGG